MKTWYTLAIGATAGVLLLALCGLVQVAGGLLDSWFTPPQTAAADAKLGATARCVGPIVVGCNVDAEQQQEQRQPPAANKLNPLEAIGLASLIFVGGLLLLVLATRR